MPPVKTNYVLVGVVLLFSLLALFYYSSHTQGDGLDRDQAEDGGSFRLDTAPDPASNPIKAAVQPKKKPQGGAPDPVEDPVTTSDDLAGSRPASAAAADKRDFAAIEDLRKKWMESAFSLATKSAPRFNSILVDKKLTQSDGIDLGKVGIDEGFAGPNCLFLPQLRNRYEEVREGKEKYVFHLDFSSNGSTLENEPLHHLTVPNMGSQLTRLIGWLGEDRVDFSIRVPDFNTDDESKDEAIINLLKEHLEKALNKPVALNPPAQYEQHHTHLVTIAPAVFCFVDILEIMYQHRRRNAAHTCGVGFEWSHDAVVYGYKGNMVPLRQPYYDGWRDVMGEMMYSTVDMWQKQIFSKDEINEEKFEMGLPVQVLSCDSTTASLFTLPLPKPLPHACKDAAAVAALRPLQRTIMVPASKFAVPIPPADLDRVRSPIPVEELTPMMSYGLAKRDAAPVAVWRNFWEGSTERLDGVPRGGSYGDGTTKPRPPGYVQGVWKQGDMMEQIKFVNVTNPAAIIKCPTSKV
ncbi:hypothetical protein HK101_004609 [Irineochytrium annulatum]|nr:hypothetical protein HK101_004609 [Irineochytrium annulatum]